MRNARRAWTLPEQDARSMLRLIEERIRASDIRVEHRDALIRLRAMVEDDLEANAQCEAASWPSASDARRAANIRGDKYLGTPAPRLSGATLN